MSILAARYSFKPLRKNKIMTKNLILEIELEPVQNLAAAPSGNVASMKITKASREAVEKAVTAHKPGHRFFRLGQLATGFNAINLPKELRKNVDLSKWTKKEVSQNVEL